MTYVFIEIFRLFTCSSITNIPNVVLNPPSQFYFLWVSIIPLIFFTMFNYYYRYYYQNIFSILFTSIFGFQVHCPVKWGVSVAIQCIGVCTILQQDLHTSLILLSCIVEGCSVITIQGIHLQRGRNYITVDRLLSGQAKTLACVYPLPLLCNVLNEKVNKHFPEGLGDQGGSMTRAQEQIGKELSQNNQRYYVH